VSNDNVVKLVQPGAFADSDDRWCWRSPAPFPSVGYVTESLSIVCARQRNRERGDQLKQAADQEYLLELRELYHLAV
jgi:hypothetical protein